MGGFVYTNLMKFPKNTLISVNDRIFSKSFLENVNNIIFGREVIHHSHITGKVLVMCIAFTTKKQEKTRTR